VDPVRIRPDPETVDPVEIRIQPDPECGSGWDPDLAGSKISGSGSYLNTTNTE